MFTCYSKKYLLCHLLRQFNGLFITKEDTSNYSWVNHCIILAAAVYSHLKRYCNIEITFTG